MTAGTHQRGGLLCGLVTHHLLLPLITRRLIFILKFSLSPFIVLRPPSGHYYPISTWQDLKWENFFPLSQNSLLKTLNIEHWLIAFFLSPSFCFNCLRSITRRRKWVLYYYYLRLNAWSYFTYCTWFIHASRGLLILSV